MLITPPFKPQLNSSPTIAWEIHRAFNQSVAYFTPNVAFPWLFNSFGEDCEDEELTIHRAVLSLCRKVIPFLYEIGKVLSCRSFCPFLLRLYRTGAEIVFDIIFSNSACRVQVTGSKQVLEKNFP